jgi:1,4-alpha-glucan branching enzyme
MTFLTKSMEGATGAPAYSARNSLKPINFFCDAPEAKSVQLVGDFNQWRPVAMQRRPDGWWSLQVELSHGHHLYRFLVDGKSTLDPRSTGASRNEAQEAVSIVAVS